MRFLTRQLLRTHRRFRQLQAICQSSDISSATKQLKNGKSAGHNSIPTEAHKAVVETSVELLYLQDMGRRIHSNRVERNIPNQPPQERRPQFLLQLPSKLPVEEDLLLRRWRCIEHTPAYTCMQYDHHHHHHHRQTILQFY
ncbi:hypothetical protein DPMN_187180 [Dreissena polymorpha]|uniref:Uncharacterized protein n=1 Tax=Dreissena polymorpha TaxID=45954 RepID=A0A9D4I8U2_DREPO|nr:hypothetical protein DPMN_187180 [Dreissena polymorpha]